jgi:drug/metabolite transporter (DMT)-like permease
MDAYTFAFLRFLVASLVMLPIALLTKNLNFHFNKKRLLFFLGITNGLAYLLQYIGIVFTTASKASLFVNLSAVWVALLSPILLKEHLGTKKILGVAASLLGVLLMTTNLDFSSLSQGDITGDLLVISAGILWAVFMVYNKPLVNDTKNVVPSMLWLMLFTLLPLLPIASFSAGNFATLPLDAWLAIVYTAVFCWVIPYYLWVKGLKHISAVTSGIVLLTEVVVAVAISTLALGEAFTVVSGAGAIFVIIAILLVS